MKQQTDFKRTITINKGRQSLGLVSSLEVTLIDLDEIWYPVLPYVENDHIQSEQHLLVPTHSG